MAVPSGRALTSQPACFPRLGSYKFPLGRASIQWVCTGTHEPVVKLVKPSYSIDTQLSRAPLVSLVALGDIPQQYPQTPFPYKLAVKRFHLASRPPAPCSSAKSHVHLLTSPHPESLWLLNALNIATAFRLRSLWPLAGPCHLASRSRGRVQSQLALEFASII